MPFKIIENETWVSQVKQFENADEANEWMLHVNAEEKESVAGASLQVSDGKIFGFFQLRVISQ